MAFQKTYQEGRKGRSTGASSARFGPCDVCEKYVSDVFIRRIGPPHCRMLTHALGHEECVNGSLRVVRAKVFARDARNRE